MFPLAPVLRIPVERANCVADILDQSEVDALLAAVETGGVEGTGAGVVGRDGRVEFAERSFTSRGEPAGSRRFEFRVSAENAK